MFDIHCLRLHSRESYLHEGTYPQEYKIRVAKTRSTCCALWHGLDDQGPHGRRTTMFYTGIRWEQPAFMSHVVNTFRCQRKGSDIRCDVLILLLKSSIHIWLPCNDHICPLILWEQRLTLPALGNLRDRARSRLICKTKPPTFRNFSVENDPYTANKADCETWFYFENSSSTVSCQLLNKKSFHSISQRLRHMHSERESILWREQRKPPAGYHAHHSVRRHAHHPACHLSHHLARHRARRPAHPIIDIMQ